MTWGTELRTVGPRSLPLLVGTSVSLLAAVTLALVHYRQVRDVTERRRLRVVVAGIVVAALPGYWAIVYRWLPSHTDQSESVFASPIMAVAAVALLAAPLSLTYAVLRHRLFDVSFIVRTALQYTLARWTVLSLVPAISLFMILETLRLRNLTVNAVLARRGGLFLLLTAIAFVVFAYRRRWLRAIDRRFFRERHYAYAVLREVAVEVGRAGSLDSAAPLVVARIEAAMHPEFVALLVRDLPSRTFKTTAATPSGSAPPDLPEDSKLVAMAFVHSHPLNTSEDGDEAVLRDLSPSDLTYVRGAHIEVVIRVATQDEHPHALLVLGPKRSEEPYANEDYGVLVTIAENLALLVGRVAPHRESPSLEECPECGTCFDGGTRVCRSHDRPLSRRSLPRRLADRYRLDRRIAAGGMGTVYEAFDTALEKPVAAKVVHENLASTDGILSRFNEEAKIAASLRGHPNVVTVYDYGLVDGHQPFIIMELLDGLTLRHLLQATQTLDPGRALDILSGVCSAVSAAHHLGLIHRDLKPENIFLTEVHGAAIPKVIDFGIARPLAFVTTATYRRHTDPNSLVGTLEVHVARAISLRGGVASLGSLEPRRHRLGDAERTTAGDVLPSECWRLGAGRVPQGQPAGVRRPLQRRAGPGSCPTSTRCRGIPSPVHEQPSTHEPAATWRRDRKQNREAVCMTVCGCGAEFRGHGAGGACPACLIRLALEPDSPDHVPPLVDETTTRLLGPIGRGPHVPSTWPIVRSTSPISSRSRS